jgi:hypothetical protein
MSLQAKIPAGGETRVYNPGRDIAHAFGDIMREVAGRLEDKRWPVVDEALAKAGVTEEQLGEACKTACGFAVEAVKSPKESMEQVLVRIGWFKNPEQANMAICATIGAIVLGYAFVGMREATLGGDGPALANADLRAAGARARDAIMMPYWKRQWLTFKLRLSNAWTAVTGGEKKVGS